MAYNSLPFPRLQPYCILAASSGNDPYSPVLDAPRKPALKKPTYSSSYADPAPYSLASPAAVLEAKRLARHCLAVHMPDEREEVRDYYSLHKG